MGRASTKEARPFSIQRNMNGIVARRMIASVQLIMRRAFGFWKTRASAAQKNVQIAMHGVPNIAPTIVNAIAVLKTPAGHLYQPVILIAVQANKAKLRG
jgi:hypothetical protein